MTLALLILFVALLAGLGGLLWRYAWAPSDAPVAPRIEAAVLTVAAHKVPGLANEIEAAMQAAVHACLARGVPRHDDETIRAAILLARQDVIDRWR